MDDKDQVVVPPLEGFVMNRVTGDYFETLLYIGRYRTGIIYNIFIFPNPLSVRVPGRAHHGVGHGLAPRDRAGPRQGRSLPLLQTGFRQEEEQRA